MRHEELARVISWATLVISTMFLIMLAPTVFWLGNNASPAVADFAELMLVIGLSMVWVHAVRHFGLYMAPEFYEGASNVIERLRGDYG